MKTPWLVLLAALATPVTGQEATFAERWPLSLEREESGVYRVTLAQDVYETAIDPGLRDVAIIDADGRMQPATLVAVPALDATQASTIDLPWFPLPPEPASSGTQRWRVVTRTGPDARVQQVETEVLDASVRAPDPTDLLVDASQVDGGLAWIELDWASQAEPVDARYVVEFSDDLDTWRPGNDAVRLIGLENQGMRIDRRRIELSRTTPVRYLRLRHVGGERPLQVTAVRGQPAAGAAAPELQWVSLPGRLVEEGGHTHVVYDSPGRYPVSRVQVWPQVNSVQRWWLESRDRDDARWQPRDAGAVAYRLRDGQGESVSPPIALQSPSRHAQWRLRGEGRIDGVPELRLGYTPETLVFLARGEPPYALVAGSARTLRGEAPMDDLLSAQRERYGGDWVASDARLGASTPMAGATALEPTPTPRRYSHWLMWGILVLGSALVAWLALGLLRSGARAR